MTTEVSSSAPTTCTTPATCSAVIGAPPVRALNVRRTVKFRPTSIPLMVPPETTSTSPATKTPLSSPRTRDRIVPKGLLARSALAGPQTESRSCSTTGTATGAGGGGGGGSGARGGDGTWPTTVSVSVCCASASRTDTCETALSLTATTIEPGAKPSR